MSVKIGELINKIIQDRSRGNPAIAEMTRAKLILKGMSSDEDMEELFANAEKQMYKNKAKQKQNNN